MRLVGRSGRRSIEVRRGLGGSIAHELVEHDAQRGLFVAVGGRAATPAVASERRIAARWGAVVGLLAVIVRIPGATRDAFWQDEISSIHVLIQSTPWGMLHEVARTEGTPPLWYALGWVVDQLGVSPHAYRAVSVLAGGVLAVVTVVIARRVLAQWAATLAGLLVAFGWQFVMHGRELRAYELFAMTTVLFAEVLLREIDAPARGRWQRLALPAVVMTGSLTSYFFVLSLMAAGIWLWSEQGMRAQRTELLRRMSIGLVPFVLWSPIMVHQYLGSRFSWIGPFTARGFLDTYWELFARRAPSAGGVLLPTLLLAAVSIGAVLLARSTATGRLIGLLALVPVLVTALIWLGGAKVYDPRNLLAAGPFAAIALARLPVAIPRPAGALTAGVVAVLVAAGAIVAEATPPTPYDAIASDLLREGWRPSDPILLFSGLSDFFAYRGPLEWYLPHDPYLTLGEPTARSRCAALFVIVPTQAERASVMRSGLLARGSTAVDGVLVGRLTAHKVPSATPWRSSHILVGRVRPACVRAISESRIVPTLRG